MDKDKRIKHWIIGVVAFGIAASWLLNSLRFPDDTATILWGLLYPFILGFIMAFLLNLPMNAIDKRLLKGRGGRLNRGILLAITLILFLIVFGLFFYLVVPQLVQSVQTLAGNMPEYIQDLEALLQPYAVYFPGLADGLSGINLDWESVTERLWKWLQAGSGSLLAAVSGAAGSLFSGVATFVIALFFSFNLVLGKPRWLRQLKGFLRAYLPGHAFAAVENAGQVANRTFSRYVGGQCLEAMIVGVAYFAVLGIGGFPYALLISVLTAITSFIPLFGVYIAYFIGLFLVLVSAGFWRAVAFTIIFVVLQQIEGNIIYPKVVGNAVGLAPGWVLVAVSLGGGLLGVGGILLFIPLFSVVYQLVYKDAKKRLKNK